MEREKKDLSFILILLSTLIGIAVLFQWAIVTELYTPQRNPSAWEKPVSYTHLTLPTILLV